MRYANISKLKLHDTADRQARKSGRAPPTRGSAAPVGGTGRRPDYALCAGLQADEKHGPKLARIPSTPRGVPGGRPAPPSLSAGARGAFESKEGPVLVASPATGTRQALISCPGRARMTGSVRCVSSQVSPATRPGEGPFHSHGC